MNFQRLTFIATATIFSTCAIAPQANAQLPTAPPAVTASDAKDFTEAKALFDAQKWPEARTALEHFVEKYKTFSPRSKDAKFMLAIALIQTKAFEQSIKQFRDLIALKDTDVPPDAKAMAQLSIAKAMTALAFERYPVTDTPAQKTAQKKVLEGALAEYDAFLKTYPKSKDGDSAYFLKGQVLVAMESYDLSVPEFGSVLQKFPQSPLRWDAQMWIGKAQFIYANSLLAPKAGKDPEPADVQKALAAFDLSESALVAAFQGSGDIAIQNDATFFIGQMQLTRSLHLDIKDEVKAKAKQMELQNAALQAFRAVRSVEEVVATQEEKIKQLEQVMTTLAPGTPEYLPTKNRIENLIGIYQEKMDGYKKGQDQYLAARMAIARIFLFLEKYDECRVLLRALQVQKDAIANDKDAQANIASMLCLTYAQQNKAEPALEAYAAFRAAFKGNEIGDNLPLLVGNLLVEKGNPDKAEEIINQGIEDYKNQGKGWRLASDATRVLCAAALNKGDYEKALTLAEKVLSQPLSPEAKTDALFLKGVIYQKMGKEKGDASVTDKAVAAYEEVRKNSPDHPKAEEAVFAMGQILADKDPEKGKLVLEQFLAKYGSGSSKNEATKANLPVAQYLIARSLAALGEKNPKLKDEAVANYRKVLEKWPDSEVAPGVLFKIFEIYNDKHDYPMCLKLMEEFVEKYPTHENVYFAFLNMSEILFSGSLNKKTDAKGNPLPGGTATIEDLEAGTLKLNSYVDYELSKDIKVKRGDSALLKVADRWSEELRKMPPFMTLTNEQKQKWQKCSDNVIATIERQLKNYPEGTRLGEGLERLVKLQIVRVKAQQTNADKVEAYFNDLASKYGANPRTKARIEAKLAEFLLEADPKRAFGVIESAIKAVNEAVKDKEGMITPTFGPLDYDRYMSGLFDLKRHDDVVKVTKRLRNEYPLEGCTSPVNVVAEAQAVALFWEGKELQEQGKNTEAGVKFASLAKDYPKSAKKMEADYGVILGDLERGQMKDDAKLREALQRLSGIVTASNTKTFELQAKALFLMGRLYEELKEYDNAVGAYLKISSRFASVPKVAGDGLWRGAQILEKQAKGDIKVLTPIEKKAANDKAAPATKAAADKIKAENEKLNPPKTAKTPTDKDAKAEETKAEKPEEKVGDVKK